MLMLAFTFLATQCSFVMNDHHPNKLCCRHIMAKKNSASQPVLQETIGNGRYVRLSDDSLWEIHPSDRAITQSWITPAEILVTSSEDSDYPFKLTNSLTKSSVLAKRASNNHPK